MFDFFRDMAHDLGGIDTKKAKQLREEKREIEKLSKFIFNKSMKRFVIAIGCLYLLLSIILIIGLFDMSEAIRNSGGNVALGIVKYAILILIDIAVLVSLLLGTKKSEIVALIGVFLFMLLLYASFFIR